MPTTVFFLLSLSLFLRNLRNLRMISYLASLQYNLRDGMLARVR